MKLENCKIFDQFLQDDLKDYTFVEDPVNQKLQISYVEEQPEDVTIDTESLLKVYLGIKEAERIINVWYPVFIWHDDHIKNKILTKESSIQNANTDLKSARLGIENFISFKPKFKHWTIDNPEAKFSIDWTLNRANFLYNLQYGLMFWYKRLPVPNEELNHTSEYLYHLNSLDAFPNYSRLGTSFRLKKNSESLEGVTLIKLNNSTLYRTDKNPNFFTNNEANLIRFNPIKFTSQEIINLSDFDVKEEENLSFYLYSDEGANNNELLGRESRTTLWIPEGEAFSYFENHADKQISQARKTISNTYISPSLYTIYRQIYHVLTLDYPKVFNGINLQNSRIIKKIASFLSTSPIMSEFGISFLDYPDIRQYIDSQIEILASVETIDQEINVLTKFIEGLHLILGASARYVTGTIDNKLSQKTRYGNIVNSRKQLCNTLMKKYGGYLNIETNTSLTYKDQLKHGDNINIQQLMINSCDKNLEGDKIYNNQEISIGNINVKTAISDEQSTIQLSKRSRVNNAKKNLYLSDIARDSFDSLYLNIAMETTSNVTNKFLSDGDISAPEVVPPEQNPWSILNYVFKTQNLPFAETRTNETEIHFRIFDPTVFVSDNRILNIFKEPSDKGISVLWEKVYGACVKFSDKNKTPEFIGPNKNPLYSYTRYDTSTQIDPHVYVYKTGEYKLRCIITTPSGTFVKTKTFYVVIGTQKIKEGEVPIYGYYTDVYEPDPISIYDYGNSGTAQREPIKLELQPPPIDDIVVVSEAQPVKIGMDNLKVICPTMTDVALHKTGMFWPLKTELSYANEDFTNDLENYRLSGEEKFFFGESGPESLINSVNSRLKLSYYTNNTKISLYKIALYNIRNETDECRDCLSFYKPIMTTNVIEPPPETILVDGELKKQAQEKQVRNIRNSKYPLGSITTKELVVDKGVRKVKEGETFDYPHVSTKYAPKIKSYGGYQKDIVNKFGLSSIPGDTPAVDTVYPSVTGYRMDYGPDPIANFKHENNIMKVCYQKADWSLANTNTSLVFDKGVFHPSSGWISYYHDKHDSVKNLSSVLKFNPGARDTFSFTGPGLYGLRSSYNSKNENKIGIFKSQIQLDMSKHVQWDPLTYTCGTVEGDELAKLREQNRKNNQLNKEYSDQLSENMQSIKHGYRYLEGGFFKLAEIRSTSDESSKCDEFGFSSSSSKVCDKGQDESTAYYRYSFPVNGPAFPITQENIDKFNFRDPRVQDFAIKDIEVKLNFMNYVNTKNLIIWLDVAFSATEEKSLRGNPNTAGQPIKAGTTYVNQSLPPDTYGLLDDRYASFAHLSKEDADKYIKNKNLLQYLNSLVDMNSMPGSMHRIFLLNQDHIQNNEYNFSVKFSDHALNSNVADDQNFVGGFVNQNQNIINNNYEIQPTISATGYTDRDACFYKNVIRTNQLNILNNKFAKFKDRILLQTPPPESDKICQEDPTYDSSTTFTLNIAVLEENDDMNVYDNISNLEFLSGYENSDTRQKSSEPTASLCSWELILHVDKTKKFVPTSLNGINNYGAGSNSLALIDYGKEPKYPGYSFIKKFDEQERMLLPSVNLNAPNSYHYLPNVVCDFADPINKPIIERLNAPVFPDWAILLILAQVSNTIISSGGSLAGLLSSLSTFNGYMPGYTAIINFLKNNRIYQEALDKKRNLYVPKYESYPFGSPEKIIINATKNNVFWYKMEASIFKYSNTPVLKPNKYSFVRLNKDIMPMFSNWSVRKTTSVLDFIDDSLIETINMSCPAGDSGLTVEELQSKFIELKLKENVIYRVNFTGESIERCKDLSGLYVLTSENPPPPEGDDPVEAPTEEAPIAPTAPTAPTEEAPTEEAPGTEQQQPAKKYNLYVISQAKDDVIDTPEFLLYSNKFLQYNNVVRYEPFITSDELKSGKCLVFDSKIPFYVFNQDNKVVLYKSDDDEQSVDINKIPISGKVLKKYLFFKDNKYHTVLVLDVDPQDKNYISLEDKDCLLVFKPQETKTFDYPIDIWGFEKEKLHTNIKEYTSLNSPGSVGEGSYLVNQQVLDFIPSINNLNNLYTIFNNEDNDKLKYNNFTMIDTGGKIENIVNDRGAAGFAIDLKENRNFFNEDFNFSIVKNPLTDDTIFNEMVDSLKYSVTNPKKNQIQIMILKGENLKPSENATGTVLNSNYGYLNVEQDFIKEKKIKQLTDSDIQKLILRLNSIQANTTFESSIGQKKYTDTIIRYGNINDLTRHYQALDDDPVGCLDRFGNINKTLCYKKRTKQALYNIYRERDDIIKLLDLQTTKQILKTTDDNNETIEVILYTPREDDKTLHHIEATIGKYEGDSYRIRHQDAIYIEYKDVSDQYYWINIDPKQSCTLANDMNPKVLTRTDYTCRYAYSASVTNPINNNVCPRFANINGENNDENVDARGTEFSYIIPQEVVDQKKADLEENYPDIKGWQSIQIERTFSVNNDSDIFAGKGGIFIPFEDILVDAVETYEMALPWHEVADTFPGELKDDGSADGVDITSDTTDDEQTSNAGGSTNDSVPDESSSDPSTLSSLADSYTSRAGLLNYTGSRDMKPNRVYNIFNLDDTDKIRIMPRKIPRIIKGVDYRNTVYRYGTGGSVFRPVVAEVAPLEVSTNSSLNNMFYYWQCLQPDQNNDWKYATLPDFYKLLNEMEFRGFFGSQDKIEHKNGIIETLYPWEIIPYEYDNS